MSNRKKDDNPYKIELDRAIELIEEKREKDRNKFIKSFEEDAELQILNGRWGPYITYKKKNYKIPKGIEAKDLSLKECMDIIKGDKKGKTKKASAKKTKTTAKKTTKKK